MAFLLVPYLYEGQSSEARVQAPEMAIAILISLKSQPGCNFLESECFPEKPIKTLPMPLFILFLCSILYTTYDLWFHTCVYWLSIEYKLLEGMKLDNL